MRTATSLPATTRNWSAPPSQQTREGRMAMGRIDIVLTLSILPKLLPWKRLHGHSLEYFDTLSVSIGPLRERHAPGESGIKKTVRKFEFALWETSSLGKNIQILSNHHSVALS